MLILSRQRDEVIVIGDDLIRITVVDIRGDKVRLGITAPKEMPVHRLEVWNEIREEKRTGVPTARRAGLEKSKASASRPLPAPSRADPYVGRSNQRAKERKPHGPDAPDSSQGT